MTQRFFHRRVQSAIFPVFLALVGMAHAHVVPDMTIEAEFSSTGGYTLRINVDPRTFLAADPTSLPPVPASWYREQRPEQVAATHERTQRYLAGSLGLLFNEQKIPLPACQIRAMDGADNTPLKADTQEVHLLATASGQVPENAAIFQIDFAREANTSLILLQTLAGHAEPRPQVVFPGETSRPFQLKETHAAVVARPPAAKGNEVYLIITVVVVGLVVIRGWMLLRRYRHHHRAHRRPGDVEM